MSIPVSRRSRSLLLLLVLAIVCVIAYWGGLSGGFQFDDYYNIVNNPALRGLLGPTPNWLFVALSTGTGSLHRPISMLSFGLNVAWFGMEPFAFKVVNLGIHLLNGALIYAIGRRIAGRLTVWRDTPRFLPETLALVAAALWLLHPLNVSGVLYTVQRMNELATLFTLCGLLCYVDGRTRMLSGKPALASTLTALCLFGLLATFSKENGALIVAYALVIEATCFRFNTTTLGQRRVLQGFFWLTIALPVVLFSLFLALHPHWLADGYAGRDFTLPQRLMSEARILCDYLLWTFVPNPAWMGLFHDDIAISTGLFKPVSTVFAIAFLAVLVVAAGQLRNRSAGFAFAVAWFLVGHAMESTVLPLELVFEHRNYLPMAGLFLGTVCALAALVPARWPARAIGFGCGVLLLGLAGVTAVRATSWGDPLTLAIDDARHHPDSSRDQYEAGRAIIVDGASRNERFAAEKLAVPYFERAASLDKRDVFAASNLMLIHARNEAVSPQSIEDLANRLRRARSYVQANPFMDLLSDATNLPLRLTSPDISTLVEAALANPHFPASVRAMIMNNYGIYLMNVVHDPQQAIRMVLTAAATEPKNAYFQLTLAKIALAVKDPDRAHQYLEAARQLDVIGQYTDQIGKLEQRTTE